MASPPESTPDVEPMMRWFAYEHLREPMRHVSLNFHALAVVITATVPRSAERTVALRKLLESKDAAVRAVLP